jgi:hypothetical protein
MQQLLTALLLVAASAAIGAQNPDPSRPAATPAGEAAARAAIDDAFAAAYSLDHDEAIARARRAIALAPESSAAHRGLAAVLWLKILFDRGAMTVDHYLGNLSKANVTLPKPDPAVAAEVRRLLERSIQLADADGRRRRPGPIRLSLSSPAGAASWQLSGGRCPGEREALAGEALQFD